VVIAYNEISIKIDYPLTNPIYFNVTANGFTRTMLIKTISEKYFSIFDEEERTYNSETNMGKYGIGVMNLAN